ISNNFLYNGQRRGNTNQFDTRVDHRLRESDSFFARYSFSNLDAYNPGFLPAPAIGAGPSYPGFNNTRGQQIVVSELHTFSPAMIYEFRAGFSRLHLTQTGELAGTDLSNKVGIPGINNEPKTSGLGSIGVSGFTGIGEAGNTPVLKV